MNIGFTGTQVGMTEAQKVSLFKLFKKLGVTQFHHGDCIGADEQAHYIFKITTNLEDIVGHPPSNDSKRAYCDFKVSRAPKDYLTRNKDIVLETKALIATPKEDIEQLRSGTWSTVRFARKQLRPVYIIYPSGKVIEDFMDEMQEITL